MQKVAGLVVVLWAGWALAEPPSLTFSQADRIESIQRRPWSRAGGWTLTPLVAGGLNDPFLLRGGAGARVAWWPSSLMGVALEASLWGQTPSASARVAQRELKARMRPAGGGWFAAATAEVVGVDGKLAGLGGSCPSSWRCGPAWAPAPSRSRGRAARRWR